MRVTIGDLLDIKQLFSTSIAYASTALRYVIAPPFCAYCKIFLYERASLCVACSDLIKPVVTVTIPVTQKYSVKVYAVSEYAQPLKSLVLAKRWSNIVAAVQLAEYMWERTYIRHASFDCIVPLPLHWTRHAWRGYNQADEMAHLLSEQSGKPVIPLLRRRKKTKFQSSIPVESRHENVHNAFESDDRYGKQIEGRHILIVDDLLTTGATLAAATRALIRYKPASVTAVVACRVV